MYNQKIIPVLFRMTGVYRGSWRFVGGVIFNFSTLVGHGVCTQQELSPNQAQMGATLWIFFFHPL
jgi:hypothetical protein